MKILQLPTEIAGQSYLTAKGLREIGHDAMNAARPNYYGYPVDYNLQFSNFGPLKKMFNPIHFFEWTNYFDVFHYHKSYLMPFGLDVKYLRFLNKPFFVEFWGSDIRINKLERERNPYFKLPDINGSKKQIKRLKYWSDKTDEVIISDNSFDIFLKPYFKKIHIVRQRIDTSAFTPIFPNPETKIPTIVHAPTNKNIKGTVHIEKAIESLRNKKLNFEYIRIESMNNSDALKAYSQSDIIVDELLLGSYGILACEGMALGKPVVTYIQDSLISTYPDGFPIVNANPDTIESVLEELILSPQKRHDIGKQGRKYVENIHDIKVVAKRLEKIYLEKLPNNKVLL
ncbi:MAG: glycosyltransferase family 4 protein [Campylobacterales bacterium]|nr:glycosyltransferase family 4 protein [Campylobacterales bacterium]